MQYRICGKTQERTSILGFGCMRLPLTDPANPAAIDEPEAIRMIRHGIDHGINYVDTAYPYHGTGMGQPGMSEPLVGKALQDGYRQRVNLATKLPIWLVESREDMDRLLNQQLERLQTDHIDFYLVHSVNSRLWQKVVDLGLFAFLDSAKADGRIRHAGFSFHDKQDLFFKVVDAYDWSFCQIQYNYMDEAFQAGAAGLQYAADKGLGIIIMEPLRGGKLAGALPQAAEEALNRVDGQRSSASWGLRWVWNNPAVSVVLSGMTTFEQLEANLHDAGDPTTGAMRAEELEAVAAVREALLERIKVPCTACGYCMPCPVGVNIPGCFNFYNNVAMFGPDNAYNFWMAPQQKAGNCVGCRKCESHCPQEIKISEELKQVVQLFGA